MNLTLAKTVDPDKTKIFHGKICCQSNFDQRRKESGDAFDCAARKTSEI